MNNSQEIVVYSDHFEEWFHNSLKLQNKRPVKRKLNNDAMPILDHKKPIGQHAVSSECEKNYLVKCNEVGDK